MTALQLRSVFLLLVCATLGGCGAGESTTAMTDGSVLASPALISSSPEANARGVADNAKIVLEFDRPMDEESVELAFSLSGVDPAQLSFAWDGASTIMTVSISGGLDVAEGTDPASVEAIDYTANVTTNARSSEGVSLAAPISWSFATVRRFEYDLAPVASLSGAVRSDDTTHTTIWLGDSAFGNSRYIGVVSFDITGIPDGAVFDLARVQGSLAVNAGAPGADLNTNFRAYSVDFASRIHAQVVDDLVEENRITFVPASTVNLDFSVGNALMLEFASKPNRFQVAFAFDKLSDDDGAADNLVLTTPILHLRYAAP